MNLWWLYAILAVAAGITIGCILAIITVGRETEERPGYLDLTAIKPRRGYSWPPVSRVRAQADLDRQAWRHPDGAIVYARTGDLDEAGMVAAGFERDDAA